MPPTSPDPTPPFAVDPIPPDLLAWARQTLDLDDFRDQAQQIERTGGHPLESVVREIEAEVRAEKSQ